MRSKRFNALPGFGLTMGFTIFYLSVIVLIPIGALFLKAFELSWDEFFTVVTAERAMAALLMIVGEPNKACHAPRNRPARPLAEEISRRSSSIAMVNRRRVFRHQARCGSAQSPILSAPVWPDVAPL